MSVCINSRVKYIDWHLQVPDPDGLHEAKVEGVKLAEKVRALLTYYNITVYAAEKQEEEEADDGSSTSTLSDSDSDTDSNSAYYSLARHDNGHRETSRAGRLRKVDLHRSDQLRDIRDNMETCMEELAITWGLDWHRIGGLAQSPRATIVKEAQLGGGQQDYYRIPRPEGYGIMGER